MSMDLYMQQARTLIEALPYIRRFNEKVVVIKYGGSAMCTPALTASVINDISLMKLVGMKPVVVHGGGRKISEMLAAVGRTSEFRQGLRVTNGETMELVEMVLSGSINKSIVQLFEQQGMKAVGLSGKDGRTMIAKRYQPEGMDIGFVGEVERVNPKLLETVIAEGFIPVLAPVACDAAGDTYNINADHAAAAVAAALGAEKLLYLTDVDGVLADFQNKASVVSKIEVGDIAHYKKAGIITGGMIPKIDNCASSIAQGVSSVHILDGRLEHSLLLEIFTDSGIGTMIYKKEGSHESGHHC